MRTMGLAIWRCYQPPYQLNISRAADAFVFPLPACQPNRVELLPCNCGVLHLTGFCSQVAVMDSFASRRRAAKPRLSRLSSITRAEDLLALAGGPDPSGSDTDARPFSSDAEGADGALYSTLSDVVVSTTTDDFSCSEDSEGIGSRSDSLNKDGTAPGSSLMSRRSGTGRVSKGLSSSSEDFDGYLSRSSATGSMSISPWRTTSDTEALDTAEETSSSAVTGAVRYLGKTPAHSKPAPLTNTTQPDSAHHLGKIPLASLSPIAEASVAAFPAQTATQAPHELAAMHNHKPAGFTDSISSQQSPYSKGAAGKIPNLHIKGASPSLERRISMSDPFFMPDSPNASASSPRIGTWDKGHASGGSDIEPEEESVWGRRMARIGSSKPCPTLDMAQVDQHPTLREQGATSLTAKDMHQCAPAATRPHLELRMHARLRVAEGAERSHKQCRALVCRG